MGPRSRYLRNKLYPAGKHGLLQFCSSSLYTTSCT